MKPNVDPEKLSERISILREVDVFKDAPVDTLNEIANVLKEESKTREEIIFRQGDVGDAMYIIKSGSVRVHVGDHVLTRLGMGKVFGEYALFDNSQRSASITSEDETELYRLDREEFSQLVESDARVMLGVLRLVLRRIREMNELEKKLAHSYLKIQKQNREIESQNISIKGQKKELEAINQELLRLNEEKYHLINVLAHDLRNPLTSSLCLADLFKSHPENLSRDQVKSIGVIENSLRRIHRIINQVVEINEIETKTIAFKPQKVNLAAILHEIGELYKYALAQKNIHLVLETEDLYSIVDPHYTSLVIENLLSNAIKFSPSGKKIWMTIGRAGDKARITIIDEGPGISMQDAVKLFGTYQMQASDQKKEKTEEPLGLSIVVKYVNAMNGKVWCESEAGKGSSLFVEFGLSSTEEER